MEIFLDSQSFKNLSDYLVQLFHFVDEEAFVRRVD